MATLTSIHDFATARKLDPNVVAGVIAAKKIPVLYTAGDVAKGGFHLYDDKVLAAHVITHLTKVASDERRAAEEIARLKAVEDERREAAAKLDPATTRILQAIREMEGIAIGGIRADIQSMDANALNSAEEFSERFQKIEDQNVHIFKAITLLTEKLDALRNQPAAAPAAPPIDYTPAVKPDTPAANSGKVKIGIIGLLPVQEGEIRKEFGTKFDLRFFETAQSRSNSFADSARFLDGAIVMIGKVGHSVEDVLKAHSVDFHRCNGSVSGLRIMLRTIAEGLDKGLLWKESYRYAA